LAYSSPLTRSYPITPIPELLGLTMTENRNFRKSLEDIARSKGAVTTVFSDFMRVAACTVAMQTREEEYLTAIKPYSKDELTEFAKSFAYLTEEMENKPFSDLVGEYYQEIGSKATRDNRGEFYTPEPISALMAQITIDPHKVIAEGKPITLSEPTCGGGGMILQTAKLFSPEYLNEDKSYIDLLRVTAQDLSPTACDMTYFNTTMWGILCEVIQGNALTNEVENRWYNFHWYRVGEDYRRALQELTNATQSIGEDKPYTPPKLDYDLGKMTQMDLGF